MVTTPHKPALLHPWPPRVIILVAAVLIHAAGMTSFAGPAPAQSAPEPPVADEPATEPSLDERIQSARDAVSRARDAGDEAKIRTATTLLELLEATAAAETRRLEFQRVADTADANRILATERLSNIEAASSEEPPSIDPTLDLAALRSRVQELAARSTALATEGAAVTSGLAEREIRRTAMRTESTQFTEKLTRNEAASKAEVEYRDERIARWRAELLALDAERRSYDATDDILRLTQRAVSREAELVQAELAVWNRRVGELETEAAEAGRRAAAMIARAQSNPIAATVAARNRELAERLAELSSEDERLSDDLDQRKALLDRMRRGLESDRRRFGGRVTPAIATVLRQRETGLPSEIDIRQQIARIREKLPETELERLLLEDEVSRLADPRVEADRVLAASSLEIDAEERTLIRKSLIELLDARVSEYAQPLLRLLNTRVDELNGIIDTDRSLLDEIDLYREFVLQQTVWVRDPGAIAPGLAGRIAEQAAVFFSPDGWRSIGRAAFDNFSERPIVGAFALGPGLLLLALRGPIRRRIRLAGDRVARAETDRFRETLLVAMFAVLRGIAFAAPFWALAVALGESPLGSRMVLALDHTLASLGWFVLVLGTLGGIVQRGGLAERHFRWSGATIRLGRRFIALSTFAVLFATCDRMCDPRELALPDLGRLFYTPIPLLIATVLVLAIRRRDESGDASGRLQLPATPIARTLLGLAIFFPLSAALLANLGWYDATSMLQRATVASLLYLASLVVVRELLFRGLHSRQRQESWRLRRQREGGEDVSEEVEDLADIGARMRSAIRFCMIGFLLAGVWTIWSELLPAFHALQGFELWSHERLMPSEDAGTLETVLVPVTLGDILLSLGMFIATFSGSRHIPTLLEVVVLDRFGLERGVRYAIVQLSQWLVLIAGGIVGFSIIGVTWSSVQWLAAGFTVGLGFGLQEIFANFISGLIILFEQPVRVGDVVTVGSTTGRISRVRMRSTTITDWDRKELVVPNKQFITQEVVNWSLGDACIRLVVPVGVSYGDDPDTVTRVLLEVGRAEPEALSDPEPHVFFAGFGDSALNFELRVFLNGTDGLVPVRNRLNTAIKKAFDAEGIRIPFPQRDVHVAMVSRQDPEGGPHAPLPPPDHGDETSSDGTTS